MVNEATVPAPQVGSRRRWLVGVAEEVDLTVADSPSELGDSSAAVAEEVVHDQIPQNSRRTTATGEVLRGHDDGDKLRTQECCWHGQWHLLMEVSNECARAGVEAKVRASRRSGRDDQEQGSWG